MIVGLIGLIVTTLVFAYAQSFWGLALARLGQGLSAGISWTIGFSMVSDLYPSEELGSVMGYVLSANTLGFLVGPPLGGLVSDWLGDEAPYLFCTGLALIDLCGRLYITPPKVKGIESILTTLDRTPLLDPQSPSHSRQTSTVPKKLIPAQHSIFTFLFKPQVIVSTFAIMVGATVFSGIEPTLPLYLSTKFKLNASQIGLIWIAIVIPNMVSSMIAGTMSDRYGRKPVTAIGLFFFAFSSPTLALAPDLFSLIVALMMFGFSGAIVLTPALPEFSEESNGLYAQAYALYNVAYSVGMMVGPLIGGYLYELGFYWQMNIFGLLNLLMCPIVVYFAWKRNRIENNSQR
jgi:MFS family permease